MYQSVPLDLELDLSNRDLTDQQLNKILNETSNMITKLDLSSNHKLTSLAAVSKFTQLEVLVISDTAIVDLSPLSKFVHIKDFEAEDAKISDITPLLNSTRLQRLILTSTKVDNQVLDIIPKFPELLELSLSDTCVSGDISKLKGCTNLQSLTLIDIDINARSLLELNTLRNLSFLNVDPECESVKNTLLQKLPSLVKREQDDHLKATLLVVEDGLKSLLIQNFSEAQRPLIQEAIHKYKAFLDEIEQHTKSSQTTQSNSMIKIK